MSQGRLQNGERIHLVDEKGRHYALTLKAGDIYQLSGHKIAHEDLIDKPDGCIVTLSGGKSMLALRPTFGDYVLKMPRGAQVLYPKIWLSFRCGQMCIPALGYLKQVQAPVP